MTSPILTLNEVHKTFQIDTLNENHVLKGLSLEVNEGDFISFIGGNGSGKSTLLNTIAGSLINEKGQMTLDNQNLLAFNEEERAQVISRVFQDPMMGTAPRMTVAENLAIALRRGETRGLSRTLNQENYLKIKHIVSKIGLNLEDKLDDEVGLLSGGQRQVITLLMATIKKPKLLLLDEHVAALDPKATEQVMKITQDRVQHENITTLMVTHNMQHAIDYGNRLIMMDQGQIVIDISGKEKAQLTVQELVNLFHSEARKDIQSDQMLLNR